MEENSKPVKFVTIGRASFAEIDPYGHVNTQHYLGHFINHRFTGMREVIGWDLRSLAKLPVQFVVRKIQIEFLKPLYADHTFIIESYVREFKERTCDVVLTMTLDGGGQVASCIMELACVDKKTNSSVPWPEEIVSKFYENPENQENK